LPGIQSARGHAHQPQSHPDQVVLIMQLEGIQVDEETRQAIEDWHYWVNRGYEL
jgi:hypothetical protein